MYGTEPRFNEPRLTKSSLKRTQSRRRNHKIYHITWPITCTLTFSHMLFWICFCLVWLLLASSTLCLLNKSRAKLFEVIIICSNGVINVKNCQHLIDWVTLKNMNILCKQVIDHCSGIHIILRKSNIQFKLKRLLYIQYNRHNLRSYKLYKVIQVQCTNFNFFPKNWEFLLVFKVKGLITVRP